MSTGRFTDVDFDATTAVASPTSQQGAILFGRQGWLQVTATGEVIARGDSLTFSATINPASSRGDWRAPSGVVAANSDGVLLVWGTP